MRILFCNKYNYHFSGAEVYMFEAMELLRSQGHEVALFSMADSRGGPTRYDRHFLPNIDFKNHGGWFRDLALAGHAIYSFDARRRIRAVIQEFAPDVAHVRNIYHHLSPSILWELKAQNVPVVYHLCDFKILCASYNLVSNGETCEACKGGKFWQVMKQKCYPGRRAQTILVAEAYVHKWLGTYRKCVDCFLAPSRFVRDKFVEHGWDARKFQVLSHFQSVKAISERSGDNAPVLYFGRLSREKGVDDLVQAMRRLPSLRLVIAGTGPERRRLEQLTDELRLTNVKFAGFISGGDLEQAIVNSRFTVLPSHAYETLGKTILESYAEGRAVIATDLGSRRELIEHGATGLLYRAGDVEGLVSAIKVLSSRPQVADAMGSAGRRLLQERNTPGAHYEALIGVYERLAAAATQRSGYAKRTPQHVTFPGGLRILHTADGIEASALVHRSFIPLHQVGPAVLPSSKANKIQHSKLRIAFIGGRGLVSKYSGIETYYEEVGKRLAVMGHQVTAYCRTYFTPAIGEYKGIRIVRLQTIRSKHWETVIHTFLSTLHVLRQPCDVVHYHALGPALFSFIPRLAGKKTIVTVQGLDWQRQKWGRLASLVLRTGEHAAVALPNRTMVVSRTLQEHYRRAYGVEPVYVPNGGLLRERRPAKEILNWGLEAGKYILFLGRFSPEKGCHLLIQAHERLNTEVKLVMAGASSYCDEYSRELRTHASGRIKLLEWVSGDALDELLTNAMIFVLPSDLEGLSLALLDAMGAGLCVLCSDVPENREAIDNTGFTFRHGDVADLADRLQFLLANPTIRKTAGEAARRRIGEHYQWSAIAANIEDQYFATMGWEQRSTGAMKPPRRASEAVTTEQRKVG